MIPTTKIGIFIDGLILLFFTYGLIELLYQTFYKLSSERRALLRVRANEESLRIQTGDTKVLQRELLKDVPDKRAIRHRVESITAIRQRGGAVEQNALSDVFVGRQSVLGSGSRHILGILIILGLLGTLIGLGQAITEAQPLSDPNQLTDLRRIARTIGGTLGGMRTAFSTTFFGLACTLFLGLFSYWFNRRQSHFINDLEDFTTTVLIPRFYPDSMETMLRVSDSLMRTSGAMDMATNKLTDVAWEIRLDESQQLVSSFEETTGILSERLQDLHDLHYRIEGIMKNFDEAADVIKNSQENLATTLNNLLPDLALKSQELANALDSFKIEQENRLEKLLKDFGETIEERNAVLTEELSKLLEKVNQTMETTATAQEKTALYINQLVQEPLNSEQFFDQVNLLRDIVAALKQLQNLPPDLQHLVGAPERQETEQESAFAEIQASTQELRQISRQLRDESLMQKQIDILERLDEGIQQINRNIEENLAIQAFSSNRTESQVKHLDIPKRKRQSGEFFNRTFSFFSRIFLRKKKERKLSDDSEDA